MAHELEIINGQASFFTVLKSAWHQLGNVLTGNPTYEEAIELARLGYDVETRPYYCRRLTESGDEYFVKSDKVQSICRTDTNLELGFATHSYHPVQNRDAMEVLRPMVEEGLIRLETGGVLRDGADGWLLGQFAQEKMGPVAQQVLFNGKDPVATYVMIRTNHSARAGVLAAVTPIRVVCANTLNVAENGGSTISVSIRHTGQAEARLAAAAEELFRTVVEDFEVVAGQYKSLQERFLSMDEFSELVLDVAVPLPQQDPDFNPEAKLAEMVVARAEKKRSLITGLWDGGIGHTGDRSAWEAYNAVTQAVDHNRDMWPMKDGAWRAASLQTGTLAKVKQSVLDSLIAA